MGLYPSAAEDGQRLEMGDGALIEVIVVGEHGAILLITFNRVRILLSPGADPSLVMSLVRERSINGVTAALMADCGFSAVNPPEWLNQLRPLLVMISVEAGNRRGLPSQMVLEALEDTTVLRTDLHGWLELTSDGEQLWVEVERKLENIDREHK